MTDIAAAADKPLFDADFDYRTPTPEEREILLEYWSNGPKHVGCPDHWEDCRAAWVLAELYVARLSAEAAREEEGRLPLDDHFMDALNLPVVFGAGYVIDETLSFLNSRRGWGLYARQGGDEPFCVAWLKTRSQVLALLAALGVEGGT